MERNGVLTSWGGSVPSALEGSRTKEEKDVRRRQIERAESQGSGSVDWENEPPLEASQYVFSFICLLLCQKKNSFRIAEIEDKIGGGLIEEVIQVAEGEHQLVDIMLESKS